MQQKTMGFGSHGFFTVLSFAGNDTRLYISPRAAIMTITKMASTMAAMIVVIRLVTNPAFLIPPVYPLRFEAPARQRPIIPHITPINER